MARLRFVQVGDGRYANLEATLGLRQLLCQGVFLRTGHAEFVVTLQHVEIGARHAQQQVLFGKQQLLLCQPDLQFGLVGAELVGDAKEGLAQDERAAAGGIAAA